VSHAQESGVQLARKNAINATKQSILEECRRAANGDWSKWLASVKPYRDALKSICYSSWQNPNPSRSDPKLTYPLISWVDDPAQLVHTNMALGMIDIGEDIEKYAAENRLLPIAIGLTQWCRAQGIDLILVPVPTKPEVYPEKLVAQKELVPADLNVIPHLRRKLLELLNHDVEVIDLYPVFMRARKESSELLYMTADTHWRERPQRLAAAEIAARLNRYPWVAQALKRPRLYQEVVRDFKEPDSFADYISDEARAQVAKYLAGAFHDVVAVPPGNASVVSDSSPLLITGDSYVDFAYPLSGCLVGHVARLINQPVSTSQTAGNLVATFQDIFRDPDVLQHKKVIIWIMNDEPFGFDKMFPAEFKIPPPPVRQAKRATPKL
jgi:alginate O-acetyltransferase complex protein AlgJ